MRITRFALVLLAVAVLTGGCGAGEKAETVDRQTEEREQELRDPVREKDRPPRPGRKLQRLELTLDGYGGPENVAIWMADSLGYFADAGLDVSIYPPLTPLRPLKYAAKGQVDLAISHQPQVVLANEAGTPVVAVGSLVAQPTAAMIWLEESKIEDVSDLKGKTIAFPGVPFQEDFLQHVLAPAGLTLADVKVKTVHFDLVPALASGRVDAIFGGSPNVEGVELEERGMDLVVTPVQDLEIPAYDELVVVARRDRLAEDPRSIRAFMSAVARGTAAAVKDPQAATEAILRAYEYEGVHRGPMEAAVEATLPLLSESGYMNPGQATNLVEWMHEQGLIQREPPVSSLFTNDFLKEPQE